jgi:mannose-1-phosphate guanylyltransferase
VGLLRGFLLAGGRGERLRPLTLTTPKCLVPINGVPLLRVWLELGRAGGLTRLLLNVSHHADLVRNVLADWSGPPTVELTVEREPRGTAGTVSLNRSFVRGEETFWIFYADNLTRLSLPNMLATHRGHTGVLTMGLFHTASPSEAGIVEMDPTGRIISFEEKPAQPRSDLAHAGVCLARAALLEELPARPAGVLDFGMHVFPALLGRMHGHVIHEFHRDIGTPARLSEASAAWGGRRELHTS